MSQANFRDPIVSASPVRTGVGNGTLTVNRLTHFTIAQTYTVTCIQKTPDTLFAVNGSLDNNVGIAIAGVQFFDLDLKVYLTITQGATPFEIGDQFVFTVANGTDLNQDNIDSYDELPQKNFGPGVKGTNAGDHSLRFISDALKAYRYIQDILYEAAVAGSTGDAISIEYLDPVPAVPATLVLQDLTFTAVTPGAAGDNISVEYQQFTPAIAARVTIQNIEYEANSLGVGGNAISVQYIGGGTAGSELVMVSTNAITVQIEDGVSDADQIKAAVDGFPAAAALVNTRIRPSAGFGSTAQVVVAQTFLSGGADAFGEAGDEEVQVSGNAIVVTLESGVSTATQVRAKLMASAPAMALVSVAISGTGSNPQTAPVSPTNLDLGADAYGYFGTEKVTVVGSAINVYFEAGKSTAQNIKTAFDAESDATDLASATITGISTHTQFGPQSARNLMGGKNQAYSFNHHELTDAGAFVEGNAGVRARDMFLKGKLETEGHSKFLEAVSLDDQNADNNSGPTVLNAQKLLNELVQDEKITVRVENETKLAWAKPSFSFVDNIVIEFTDTDITNTISAFNSPISISDGQSAYVILNRHASVQVAVLVADTIPRDVDAFRIASRFGDHIRIWDGTFIADGSSTRPGEGGSGGGITKVTFFDPVSSTLPTGSSATFDGIAAQNKDLILFTNLSVNNNQIHEINGVGTSITFTPVSLFSTGVDPVESDLVIFQKGNAFKQQIAAFDGTTFNVNDYVRYFNGADYWEVSSLKTIALLDNTTDDVFDIAFTGSENIVVEFSILRGSTKEIGQIHMTTDGTDVSMSVTGATIGLTGVSFVGSIVGSNIKLQYTTDASGSDGTLKFFVRRWANDAGGPAGLPSYSSATSGSTAAGSNGQVQFNGSGVLAADTDFTYDATNNILTIAGLEQSGSSASIILANNQPTPTTMFQYVAASYPFVIVEFSCVRDGVSQVGRMLITTNGTDVGFSEDSVATDIAGLGISFSATISGANVQVQFTSTDTGFASTFKYSVRRWS